VRQPANVGPVIFSNTSPSYARLKPIKRETSGLGPETGGRAVGALMLVVAGGLFVRARRTKPVEVAERARARR
jgi:hypothetical protein